jgi:multidrug efflux pump subunit AcrA (membrane-fusion protein)
MRKRYALLGAAALVAASLAVSGTAVAADPSVQPLAKADKTAKKALKKAKAAKKTAKAALAAAEAAQAAADAAQADADAAQADANAAQTDATKGIADAATAQAAAEAAQATANGKFGDMTLVTGDTLGPDSGNKTAVAVCPVGTQITGGGYFMAGTGRNDVTVVFNSQFINGWVAIGEEIGAGTPDNWSLTATVECIDQ